MGLENLKSVFNDLTKNVKEDFGGPHGQGVHGGLTNERPSTPSFPDKNSLLDNTANGASIPPQVARVFPDNRSMKPTLESGRGLKIGSSVFLDATGNSRFSIRDAHPKNYSILDDITQNKIDKNLLQSKSPINILGIDDTTQVVDYSPFIETPIGTYSGTQTFNELLSDKIKKKTFDITTLGKNGRLGDREGPYVLGTLFKHNHRGSPQRIQIDTGVVNPNSNIGETIKINTGRAGIGSLSNLDIKGYSTNFRTGLIGDGEPYIVNDIGSPTNQVGNNRDLIPWRAALDDVSRLAQFYTSPAGLAFTVKENITNVLIGDGLKVTEPFNFVMAPPVPVPNTGFLNFYQQSIQGAGLGSIRKPFKIQYSTRALTLPFGKLGDRPVPGLEKAIDKAFKAKEPEKEILKKAFNDLKVRATLELNETFQVPLSGRPTPFIDLSKGPKETDYVDRISLQPVLSTESDKDIAPKNKGDFYVKIKDLRNNNLIYFRGYVTGITENVNPSFTPTNYIGRSEPVYIYERGERDISFNLRVYPQNATEQKIMYDKIEKLTSLAYPNYLPEQNNNSLIRMQPPFTELYMAHIGTRKKGQFGIIKSISYTVNEQGDWDALRALPRYFDINISYQILSKKTPDMNDRFYGYDPYPEEK